MKRKIAYVITRLELGGAQQHCLYLAEHLDRSSWDVTLITGPGGILDEAALKIPCLKVIFLSELRHEIAPAADIHAVISLAKIFRKEKFTVVHTHSSKAGITGRIAAHLAGVPVVIHTIHGFPFHGYQPRLMRKAYTFLERLAAKFTTILIAVTEKDVEKGLRAGVGTKNQYRIIFCGIELEKFKNISADRSMLIEAAGFDKNSPVVGMIACFKPQKSPLDFVLAADLVRQKIPSARFVAIGDGILRPDIEKLIAERRLGGIIKLLGWRHDVPDLLSGMDVVVLTSKWEGLPLVVLQALSAGKPVVATAVDGTAGIIENGVNGFLVVPGDAGAMAEKIVQLLKEPGLRMKIGNAGKNMIVPDFDIRQVLVRITELYFAAFREPRL